jgi:hypothetical protein
MGLLIVAAIVVVIAAGASIWLFWRINQETVTPVVVTNPGGQAGKAFLVYQPGLTDFQERVMTAFVSGLAAAGWQVATTTASAQAPVPDATHNLVVFGAPVYQEAPANPLARYVARVGDLGAKPVVILLTGATDVAGAIATTERIVIAAKGQPIRSLGFTTTKSNDEMNKFSGSNVERALQVASEAGRKLSLATR